MTNIIANAEERILNSAKSVFIKYGLYGARMQDIANEAGINKALLHYYFRNKEKLFDKVFEGALQKYFDQMDVFSNESLPIKDRLYSYCNNMLSFLEEYPQMTIFIIKEISINPAMFGEKVLNIKKPNSVPMIKALEKAIAAKEIAPMDTALFMVNLHSLCAYPFIASPLFKHALKANNKNWEETSKKLLESVHRFIDATIYPINK